mgnify:CR=1 FL=1
MKARVKVYSKGIIVLPKEIRELAKIREGDLLFVEVRGNEIVMRPIKPKRVSLRGKVQEIVKEVKEEEMALEV